MGGLFPTPKVKISCELTQTILLGCCGVRIFSRFEAYTIATVKEYQQEFTDYLLHQTKTSRIKEGLAIAAINHAQSKYWNKILTDAGFVMSRKAKNGNTQHTIYLYTKVLQETTESETDK